MGCNCQTSKKAIIETEIKFESNEIIKEKEQIKIKSNLKEKEILKNKFLYEIEDKESYNILDSINLKEHVTYECIQAYEIFMNDKKRFEEIYEKEFPNKNEESENDLINLNNTNNNINNENIIIDLNSSNNNEEILFKMPPIQHLNNTIYEGEFFFDEKTNQYINGGDGILITSKNELIIIKNLKKKNRTIEKGTIFYPNGDIFIGEINKEEPYNKIIGILFEKDENNKYDNFIISYNFNERKPKIVKYFSNGDLYEGEAEFNNDKYIFSGKGKLTNVERNEIYDGEFKGGLFNGEGKLFSPLGGIYNLKNIEKNIGKSIITKWVNGKPYGNGLIREKLSQIDDYKNTSCSFRFGKIIKSIKNLVKGKKILDENIYNFLSLNDILNLFGSFKTKSFYNFLKKNNKYNLIKIKLFNALLKQERGLYNKEIFNHELFNISKKNSEEIYSSLLEDKNYFLPFVCYRSEGGEIEKRYRPFNMFNPNQKKIYSTNYLNNKSKNITLNAIFNLNILEEFKAKEEFYYDKSLSLLENFLQMGSLYDFYYEKFEKNYPVRRVDTDLIDYSNYIFNKELVGNYDEILCTFQYIMFSIPEKIDELTVLINPCYCFCVYIGTYKNICNKTINYINITDEEIKGNNYDINLICDKYKNYIMKIEKEKKLFEYIEFDTMKQNELDMKILCLVKIYKKTDINYPYIIKLKKFFHYGNIVDVKLINQKNIYNQSNKGFSIDFGTINFFGDIIYLNE